MATAVQKITLSASRDIPFNKLVLSQSNVRRTKAGVSIEELAEDIARRGLLQSLSVRPVLDSNGNETGMFEVPAGGRRYRALELLTKQKRLAKTTPVPCVAKNASEGISAEEDSLAENIQRAPLHPLDQFNAFQTLRVNGLSEDEIAARFFVSPAIVKQRLKLVQVSPKLLDLYAEDGMTLEQLMAFTVTNDHARQERVWESIATSHNQEPYYIRRQLTEGAVKASDKRAQFVGVEAYEAAGGAVTRDLFEEDDGGWLQDPALLDRLAIEKLKSEAESLRGEGWKWIAAAIDFPYGHTQGLRRLAGQTVALSDEEVASYDALHAEHRRLEEQYAGTEDLPEAIDQRLGEIETALAAFDERPVIYDPVEIARAGAFVSVGSEGELRIERGYVKPEDEAPVEPASDAQERDHGDDKSDTRRTVITIGADVQDAETADEDEGLRPLPDRLVTELTAHRTLALRDALANAPDTAFVAALHVLCLAAFYHHGRVDSCLEITTRSVGFGTQAPGLNDSAPAKAIEARHVSWATQLPEQPANLWDALLALDAVSRMALFAHCAALAVNVVKEPWNRRTEALAHGDVLARSVGLDMTAGWSATVDNYLGRVPKVRILEAVLEAKGEASAQLIDHLKKPEMAKEAERLLSGTGWLPEPLRTPEANIAVETPSDIDTEALPAFLADDARSSPLSEPQPVAAE
jgi:ParB family chromosome partitioning protein